MHVCSTKKKARNEIGKTSIICINSHEKPIQFIQVEKQTYVYAAITEETEIHVIGVSHMMFMRTSFRPLYYYKHLNGRWYSNKGEMQKYRTIGVQEEKTA